MLTNSRCVIIVIIFWNSGEIYVHIAWICDGQGEITNCSYADTSSRTGITTIVRSDITDYNTSPDL